MCAFVVLIDLALLERKCSSCAGRFALIADNGVVSHVAVEQPGKFEESTAEAIFAKL